MIAAVGFGLLGLFLLESTTPPDISGHWTGEGWGQVELEEKHAGSYDGTYTDTFGEEKGRLQLEWSRTEGRFKGTWREGKDRFGKISVRLVDKEIRGAWTTSKKSRIDPGTPELADLLWTRSRATEPEKKGAGTGPKRRSYMLEFNGRQTHVDIPKLRYDGSHPITFEATVMSLYRGSIIADFNGSGLGLDVADGYCSFHVNDGRTADNNDKEGKVPKTDDPVEPRAQLQELNIRIIGGKEKEPLRSMTVKANRELGEDTAASGLTDMNGSVALNLRAGDYYIWRSPDEYEEVTRGEEVAIDTSLGTARAEYTFKFRRKPAKPKNSD